MSPMMQRSAPVRQSEQVISDTNRTPWRYAAVMPGAQYGQRKGLAHSMIIYYSAISACEKGEQPDKAWSSWEHAAERPGTHMFITTQRSGPVRRQATGKGLGAPQCSDQRLREGQAADKALELPGTRSGKAWNPHVTHISAICAVSRPSGWTRCGSSRRRRGRKAFSQI